jgi:polyisoprenyl-phosphate glycosyltransferase
VESVKRSLIIPVYRNEESIPDLLEAIGALAIRLNRDFEVVFVVDGSPDGSYALLRENLPLVGFPAQLLLHARNFGSFAAIRSGLAAARGEVLAVMAADLQEPTELMERFFAILEADEVDVVVGTRTTRADPLLARVASSFFWWSYRTFVQPDIPAGGVDVFACTRAFRDELLALGEANTSLVGQIFWLGFRRASIPYERLPRKHGRSAWSLSRKIRYLMDSLFAFSDLPIRLLIAAGGLGIFAAISLAIAVGIARIAGLFHVPGYAMTMATVLFFGSLNAFGLGIIGAYTWRAYENTKARPLAIVRRVIEFGAEQPR